MKAYVVSPTYRVIDNKAYVHLFGRLENGESFLSISLARPYIYIKKKDLPAAMKLRGLPGYQAEEVKWRNFGGEEVVKLVYEIPSDTRLLRDAFERAGIVCYEADIRFAYRFMMDRGILGTCDIQGDYEPGKFVGRLYRDPVFTPASFVPKLKVLSLDIETDRTAQKVYSVGLVMESYKQAFLLHDRKFVNATPCASEAELLTKVQDKIVELDPDIIVGWNIAGFDFAVLARKFKEHRLPFQLGRAEWPVRVTAARSFFQDAEAEVPGRVVLDGIAVLKNSFLKLGSYRLGRVAQELLGAKKLFSDQTKADDVEAAHAKDPQALVDYNLTDCHLVLDILEKTGTLALTLQRSLLTGMPLDRIAASIASFDSLYIRELRARKIVAPTAKAAASDARVTGGYVMTSAPGIYDHILVHDFKSLYPSIIRTFNIDPWRYLGMDVKGKGIIRAPNGACFAPEDGILPLLIQRIWEQRDLAKKRGDRLTSQALKITMNSFWGVLASPMCRFFSLDMANGITHFGQFIIKLTAEEIRKLGFEVIYSDTDSCFTKSNAKDEADAGAIGQRIAAHINGFYDGYIRREYGRRNFLELEFEKVFLRFVMPQLRHAETGSKKRYAGLVRVNGREELVFTGLEFVRRDWTELAKKFQEELFWRIFRKQEVAAFVKDFVKDVRAGKHDGLLVYRKAIRKELEDYTKTTPPHVKAARKAGGSVEHNLVEYVMTVDGPESLTERRHKIDYDHYIDKQVKPIADSILVFFKTSFEDVLKASTQKTLFGFGK